MIAVKKDVVGLNDLVVCDSIVRRMLEMYRDNDGALGLHNRRAHRYM